MRLFALLLIFTLALPVFGRDYLNVVKVDTGPEMGAYLSGSVIKETEQHYFILTCNHVMFEKKHDIPLGVEFISADRKIRLRCEAEIILRDEVKDLMLLRVPNLPELNADIVKLGKGVVYGEMAKVYGFTTKYLENNTYIMLESDQIKYSLDGSKLLRTKGPCLQGVSGGPLVQKNVLVGVQTAKDGAAGCLYVHIEAVREFLEW